MCLAIPGQVVELIDVESHLARVEVAGVHRTVNVGLLVPDAPGSESPPSAAPSPDSSSPEGSATTGPSSASDSLEQGGVEPGDWVLIHVGFAISKVDEEEAARTFEFLQTIGQDFEDELEDLKGSDIA